MSPSSTSYIVLYIAWYAGLVRTVVFEWWKRWKLWKVEKCIKIWNGYGVNIELVPAKCCHLNLMLTKKIDMRMGDFPPVPTPFNVVVQFKNFASVRLLSACAHRHICCHERRYWYAQLVFEGIRWYSRLLRWHLRLARTVIYVRTCLWCLVYIWHGHHAITWSTIFCTIVQASYVYVFTLFTMIVRFLYK